jgi:NifU-like protein involved in Fe-S cluster formation
VSAARLYTPEVLALATSLAQWPLHAGAPGLTGTARSVTCGSVITVLLDLDEAGAIRAVGLQVQACAVGQAAATLFADAATGHNWSSLAAAEAALRGWLGGKDEVPEWPGLSALAAARDYPARHPTILLPWMAALSALSSDAAAR